MFQLASLACEILEFSCLCLAMFGINNIHPCPAFSMSGAGDWDSVPMFVNKPSYSVIIFDSFLFCQNDFKIISLLASFVVSSHSPPPLVCTRSRLGKSASLVQELCLPPKIHLLHNFFSKVRDFFLIHNYLFLQGADVKQFTTLGQIWALRLTKCTHVFLS